MRTLRNCNNANLNTGVSKCQPDFGKMKGAIIVEHGTKLPADLTADALEKLAHADRPSRIYGVFTFCEYAKNGGEVQTAANGYGGEEVTGISARKDTYTLDKFYPELHASFTKSANAKFDVYFVDENNILYGMRDDSDTLAGFPMSTVYTDATPHPTSSAAATMNITFAHSDAKKSFIGFDYVELGFDVFNLTLGLVAVCLAKSGAGTSYKLYEKVGGYDVTPIYGPLIVEAGADVLSGTTSAATYDSATKSLTITATDGTVPHLKAPKVLYEKDIKGIEEV